MIELGLGGVVDIEEYVTDPIGSPDVPFKFELELIEKVLLGLGLFRPSVNAARAAPVIVLVEFESLYAWLIG